MAIQLEKDPSSSFNLEIFQQNLHPHYRKLLHAFKKIIRSYVWFNISFFAIFIFEVVLLFAFLTSLSSASFIAFSLGSLFLTSFTYFVLLFYFQAKKPEQLAVIRDEFIQACKKMTKQDELKLDYHLFIAHAVLRLVTYLDGFEWNLYRPPRGFHPLISFFEKFSIYFHWKDVFKMKEMLLQSAIEEHVKQIRVSPTDVELHTSLANTYVSLSKLYLSPNKLSSFFMLERQLKKQSPHLQEKFKSASRRAIEEFKILNNYAPDDPWIHLQLAKGYHDLQMSEEEIKEYETILKLKPGDKEILFRLGILYFELGLNAKGLKVYETLKKAHYKKAENLIRFFGCFSDQSLFEDLI